MSKSKKEIERRTSAALAAIKRSLDDRDDDADVSLFALSPLEPAYWKKRTQVVGVFPNRASC